ncbi:hypothetical protein GCM10010329_27960 [Streptomyces spiroverticillatus]|uniref:Peptidase M20 dimerisation domain-containing protein n=1 Tax=Streptomyces finlayi TaxID=67296 RepID=A0A918WVQ3_9ACTN|nr:TOMM precursor leader peptide-binding protein [Streptomyces finlayi]GHA03867.1 hypothetical protein GCM10010329_27960 [Streptomyces spiroverticillatus]GHC87996.1 hypothetical protein GCM10010334_20370 [Streptomyces finlayi]
MTTTTTHPATRTAPAASGTPADAPLEAARSLLQYELSARHRASGAPADLPEPLVVPLGGADSLGFGHPDPYAAIRPEATVQLTSRAVLIGPWGGSGDAVLACGQCLAMRWQRLRSRSEREALELGHEPHGATAWPVFTAYAVDAVWAACRAMLPGGRPAPATASDADRDLPQVTRIDLVTLASATFPLLPEPLCPSCVQERPDTEEAARIVLGPAPKADPDGYRGRSLGSYPLPTTALANPVCGALGSDTWINPASTTTAPVAGTHFVRGYAGLNDITWSGQANSYGTSRTLAFLEGLERYAGTHHGATVARGVGGGQGVVGVLRNGAGPTVMLRAELDALPVQETTGLPYASTVPGVMHACGHDLHLAAAAGALALLARTRDTWRGTVVVVGQPAEETLEGARAMLADGLYERFGTPALVLAQHTAPLPAGTVAPPGPGPLMSAGATVDVVIHGRGGHGGTPHLTVDPVLTAAGAVVRLQSVVSRETAPAEQVVLTVGALRAGERANVIPDRAELSLSVRAFSDAALARAVAAVERIVRGECAASGCPAEPEFLVTARSPVLTPDAPSTAALRRVHEELFGGSRVTLAPPLTATEDFPWFGAGQVPLAYWLLGVTGARQWRSARAAGTTVPANHAPDFAPDVRTALPTGITAMAAAALHRLAAPAAPSDPKDAA